MTRKRILFVAEAVTLAQVVRLRVLAASLDPARYDVHFASSTFDPLVFAGTHFTRWHIASLTPHQVERAVARGSRIYSAATLSSYVDAELGLFDRVRPDLVVGDLRWSLAVSAPHAGVPLASLINAYWSPFAHRDGFPMPDHPVLRLLAEATAERYFPRALPWVFQLFARPLNVVRRRYGLPPLGDLLELLTYGDYTVHPDVSELTPLRGAPHSHVFLGPVLWSAAVACPALAQLGGKRPLVYVTLGSSGHLAALNAVLDGLGALDVDVLLATAGRVRPMNLPANVHVADFVPGDEAARRASLVVCNGGSTTAYQALAAGTPVLGVAFNFDQHLAMQAIDRYGAGVRLRATTLEPAQVRNAATHMLASTSFRARAASLRDCFATYDYRKTFASLVSAAT